MPDSAPRLTPLQQALVALKELRARLNAAERARNEPIAIVGIGCRFPGGADHPEALWQLLHDGVDAVTDVPPDRWDVDAYYDPDPTVPGKMATRWGSFLDDVDRFDARFFGLSGRETVSMDPQQRLLLEVAWETLEYGGIAPDRLSGTSTGVFVGLCNADYAQLVGRSTYAEPYMATGNTASVAAGRVSYVLGLQGPSLAVDTACSSSLVAVHLACQSLRNGESDLALAGGVNLILSPVASVALSQLQIMSPDGRCRTFDAGANGIVRGEGCAMVALKRLSDAQADGDTILAVIKGSAVNQDGRSGGLTAPNGPAQEAVTRAALASSGIAPTEVDFIETHGTATPLGDPIEVRALANVLGQGRPRSRPLLIGSIKTNLGHTEATAGVAGLLKVVLALRHGTIPPHLHCRVPSPHIPWDEIPVRVAHALTPWPAANSRRVGAVSSFGFSGTNAHVVLEAPATDRIASPAVARPRHLLTLSARTEPALRDLAARYARHLETTPDLALTDVCWTAGHGRAQLRERLALTAASTDEMAERLAAFVGGGSPAGLLVGRTNSAPRRVAFLFDGRPAHAQLVGGWLYETEPTFRRAIDRAAECLADYLPRPLTEILFPATGTPLPAESTAGDLAHIALQCALAEVWRSWGIQPRALLGRDSGQYAAAVVGGGLPLEEAARLLVAGSPLPASASADRSIPVHSVDDVSLADVFRAVRHQGSTDFLDVGPTSRLLSAGQACLSGADLGWLPSLRPCHDDWQPMLESLGNLWVRGEAVDWAGVYQGQPRRTVALPTYPFQRERYWVEVAPPVSAPGEQTERAIEHRPEVASYELRWQPKPPESSESSALPKSSESGGPGRWLILADRGGVGEELARQLRANGDQPLVVETGQGYARRAEDRWQVDPADPSQLRRLWQESSAPDGPPWRGAVHLWGLDADPVEAVPDAPTLQAAATRACGGLLHLVQALAGAEAPPRIRLVTRDCQPVSDEAAPLAVEQAPLWGLGRVIALEHPELWGGAVDLDPARTDPSDLLAELRRSDVENQVALRDGRRLVPRVVATSAVALPRRATESARQQPVELPELSADATYLLAGGSGALGQQVAAWLMEHGARHLVLIGRRHPSDAVLAPLYRAGARVEILQADLAHEDDLSPRLVEALRSLPPLRGVVHTAGVLDDGVLLNQSWERIAAVLAPKVAGAWGLHRLTRDLPLDFFVMFSSAASLLGSPGQAGYVAANAFLDALAHHRRGLGLPATSINWGPWAEAGMAASADERRWGQRGLEPLLPATALAALQRTLMLDLTQVGILDADWSAIRAHLPGDGTPPTLAELVPGAPPESEPAEETWELLRQTTPEDRPTLMEAYLRRELARVLGIAEAEIAPDANLVESGIDSLMVMDLVNTIKRGLRITLYPREVYERPTLASLAAHLSTELDRDISSPSPGAAPQAVTLSVDPPTFGTSRVNGEPTRAGAPSVTSLEREIVLLLSGPRTGSTLLRVMLAGHPNLFAPPELHLLPFATMAERNARMEGSYLGEGLQRALMELRGCDAATGKAQVDEMVGREAPIADVYRLLQQEAAPRTLVDKSPSYAGSLDTLRRIDALFERVKVVHLVRHPYAAIESFARMRMHRLVGADNLDPHVLAEQIWTVSNANVLRFRAETDPDRYHLVQYERLVAEPATVMAELCAFLGLPFHDALLTPYEGARMTDGVSDLSAPIGDPRFGVHDRIDPQLGEAWRTIQLPYPLGEETRSIAAELDYLLPFEQASPAASVRPTAPGGRPSEMRERFLTPRGSRLCLCAWGPEHGRPVVCLHGILEHGAVWDPLAGILAARGYHVLAADQRGHGRSGHVGPGGSYHLIDFVVDLDVLLRDLELGPVMLVGHSFGAAVAAALAAARPALVDGLVLIEPPLPTASNGGDHAARLAVQLDYLAAPPRHPILPDLAAATERLRRATPVLPEEQAMRWAARLTEVCDGGLRWRWDPLLNTRAPFSSEGPGDAAALLGGLLAPVTLVGGSKSGARTLDGLAELAAGRPGTQLVTLPSGHHPHIETPAALAELIADAATRRSVATPSEETA